MQKVLILKQVVYRVIRVPLHFDFWMRIKRDRTEVI
jgi:hypothetical protein